MPGKMEHRIVTDLKKMQYFWVREKRRKAFLFLLKEGLLRRSFFPSSCSFSRICPSTTSNSALMSGFVEFRFYMLTAEWHHEKCIRYQHCAKSVRVRSFSGSYSVRMRENTDQKYSEYRHFSRSAISFFANADLGIFSVVLVISVSRFKGWMEKKIDY